MRAFIVTTAFFIVFILFFQPCFASAEGEKNKDNPITLVKSKERVSEQPIVSNEDLSSENLSSSHGLPSPHDIVLESIKNNVLTAESMHKEMLEVKGLVLPIKELASVYNKDHKEWDALLPSSEAIDNIIKSAFEADKLPSGRSLKRDGITSNSLSPEDALFVNDIMTSVVENYNKIFLNMWKTLHKIMIEEFQVDETEIFKQSGKTLDQNYKNYFKNQGESLSSILKLINPYIEKNESVLRPSLEDIQAIAKSWKKSKERYRENYKENSIGGDSDSCNTIFN